MNRFVSKASVCILCLFHLKTGYAQNVGISSTSNFTPDASAGLDVNYTNKGLLVPRVALTAANAAGPVTAPATSLLVYNTVTAGTAPNNVVPGYYYWDSTAWVALNTSVSGWSTTGNAGTAAGTNFIGTTDATDFVFKTNNTEWARLSSGGGLGLGTSAFGATNPEKLLIDAGTTTNTPVSTSGTINDYFQFQIQNLSNGTAASTDIVATANNGTDNGAYIDMGINSSTYPSVTTTNQGVTTRANTAYLYSNAGDFVIGNGAPAKPLIFFTNNGVSGQTTAYGTERMRIVASGNLGVGTTAPTSTLDLNGSVSVNVVSKAVSYSISATDYIIINTNTSTTTGSTFTLPAASGCTGRMYRIINHGGLSMNISPSVVNSSGGTVSTLGIGTSANVMEVVSDGTNWQRINQ